MKDEDIYAFRPVPDTTPALARRRRVWPWALLGLALLLITLLVGAGIAALSSLADWGHHGWHFVVNGEPWNDWADWGGWSFSNDMSLDPAGGVWALLGVGIALLVVLTFVPLAVVFALLMAGLGIALGLAATLGAVALVLLVLFSPLWLLVLLLWLMLRRRPAARMAA